METGVWRQHYSKNNRLLNMSSRMIIEITGFGKEIAGIQHLKNFTSSKDNNE